MIEIDLNMSNFDHKIDKGMAEVLKADEGGKFYGHHFARNFCGEVFYKNGLFHEHVSVNHIRKETLSAETLEDLMMVVNKKYGSD